MKLTNNTMNVLKNFSTINQNIYVKPGNVIETVSKQKNILAKATVEENFPQEFGIYDLNNFLGVLSLSKGTLPELDFEDQKIIIRNRVGKSSTTYHQSKKELLLLAPEKKVSMENAEIIFTITEEDLDWCLKAASALNSTNIAFVSDCRGHGCKAQIKALAQGNCGSRPNHAICISGPAVWRGTV